jgi:alginate O-acetyltransferase complex protein AlgJ
VETSSNISSTSPGRDRWLMGLFLAFLILPLLDLEFHIDPTLPQSENRLPASFPAWPKGLAGLKPFQAGWEAYFNDHFGFRRCLVSWGNKFKWAFFHAQSARNVLAGTDGWMFFSGSQMLEQYCGDLQLSDTKLQAWQKLLERRRDWLAQRGIPYIFVLAPDKQSIYPEKLPAWLKDLGGRTRVDQFVDYMRTHSTVEVLDLRPVLLEAKKTAPIYQKTDTHWNYYGAFVAYQELVRTLAQKQVPGLKPLRMASFEVTNEFAPGGDMARSLGVNMLESNAVIFIPQADLPPLDIYLPPENTKLKEIAYAKNPRGKGLVVVFNDSFGRYWVSFLGYQFAEADFVWHYDLNGPLIERKKPVFVVNEMVERFFDVEDPKKLYTQDVLPP